MHKYYEVIFQGAVQDPASWHLVIERASKKTLYLSLRAKTYLCLPPLGAYSLADSVRIEHLLDQRSSRPESSASSENSDDGNPDSSMSAADKIPSANASDLAPSAAVGGKVHQPLDNESKDPNTERHAPVRAEFPKFDSDGLQIASVNEPYIFLRAVSVFKKPNVSDNGIGKPEKVAHPGRVPPSAADIHGFRYDTQRLEKIFADMDNLLRSKNFKRSRVYQKCPSRTLEEVSTRSMQILQEGEMAFQKNTKVNSKIVENISSKPTDPDKEETEMLEMETESEEPPVASTKLDLERQKRFLKLAKALFKYFLPLKFNSALVEKYWGAVYVLIEVNTIILLPILKH